MNEAFRALPKEKQRRVLNAALAEFGEKEYKRASTDQIAARARISRVRCFITSRTSRPFTSIWCARSRR